MTSWFQNAWQRVFGVDETAGYGDGPQWSPLSESTVEIQVETPNTERWLEEYVRTHIRIDGEQAHRCKTLQAPSKNKRCVYKLEFKDRPSRVVKFQENHTETEHGLAVAKMLDCELVNFTTGLCGQEGKKFRVTIMDFLPTDCWYMKPLSNDAEAKVRFSHFVTFMEDLRKCLTGNGNTYCDMKLDNVGTDGKKLFRLIDLDALDDGVATYPAILRWKTNYEYDSTEEIQNAKALQTDYAFGLAILLLAIKQTGENFAKFESLVQKHPDNPKAIDEIRAQVAKMKQKGYTVPPDLNPYKKMEEAKGWR